MRRFRNRSARTPGLSPLSDRTFEDNRRHCVMLGVTKCNQRGSDAPFCSKLLRWPRKNQERFAIAFFPDVDIAPTHRFAYPGAERFCHGFLAGKARSQMSFWKFHRHRIFDLAIRENAMQKTITESSDGTPNTHALAKIYTDTNHAHLELSSRLRSCLALGSPPLPFQGRGLG